LQPTPQAHGNPAVVLATSCLGTLGLEVARLELLQEPQSLLGEGQRQRLSPIDGRDPVGLCRLAGQSTAQHLLQVRGQSSDPALY
jgi:hypothetical protein